MNIFPHSKSFFNHGKKILNIKVKVILSEAYQILEKPLAK